MHVLVHARVTRILDMKSISKRPTFNAVEFTQDSGGTQCLDAMIAD